MFLTLSCFPLTLVKDLCRVRIGVTGFTVENSISLVIPVDILGRFTLKV